MKIFVNYAFSTKKPQNISNMKINTTGFTIQPLSVITNPPIDNAHVNAKITINKKYAEKKIELKMPKGHGKGQSWVEGLKTGLVLFGILALLVGGWFLAGSVLASEVGSAVSGSIFAGAVGGTAASLLGMNAGLEAQGLAESFSILKTFADNIDKIPTDDFISLLSRKAAESNSTKDISTLISKKTYQYWKNKDAIKKVNHFSESLKNSKEFVPLSLDVDSDKIIKVHTVSYGEAHAASVWGDRSVLKMRGMIVIMNSSFEYDEVTYGSITK